jgi:hypothetical protein
MGDEATEARTLLLADPGALVQSLREEMSDQVRFVVTLDPKGPVVAFTLPDCGSEELGCKVKHIGAVASVVIDQVFKWTTSDNYDVDAGEDHDPSIA